MLPGPTNPKLHPFEHLEQLLIGVICRLHPAYDLAHARQAIVDAGRGAP
jgi:hypothetical protein